MIVFQQLFEPLEQVVTLLFGEIVDELHVLAYWIETLPACDWVRPDDWMDGSEVASDVLGCSTWLLIELEATALGCFDEVWTAEGAGETFEESLVVRAQAVVELVAGCP